MRRKPRVNSIVELKPPTRCPRCGVERPYRHKRFKKTQIDLRFGPGYIKRWVTEYRSAQYRCRSCRKTWFLKKYMAVGTKYGQKPGMLAHLSSDRAKAIFGFHHRNPRRDIWNPHSSAEGSNQEARARRVLSPNVPEHPPTNLSGADGPGRRNEGQHPRRNRLRLGFRSTGRRGVRVRRQP